MTECVNRFPVPGEAPPTLLTFLLGAASAMAPAGAAQGQAIPPPAVASADGAVLFPLTAPFLFAYGTWDKRASVEAGVVVLRGAGLTPNGRRGRECESGARSAGARRRESGVACAGRRGQYAEDAETSARRCERAYCHVPLCAVARRRAERGVRASASRRGSVVAHPNEVERQGTARPGTGDAVAVNGRLGRRRRGRCARHGILAVAPVGNAALPRLRRERSRQRRRRSKERRLKPTARRRGRSMLCRLAQSPVAQAIYAAAPDVLALEIHSGTITPSRLLPYVPQAGRHDKKRQWGDVLGARRAGRGLPDRS